MAPRIAILLSVVRYDTDIKLEGAQSGTTGGEVKSLTDHFYS